MEKEIVKKLCKKYNEEEKVIKVLMDISFNKGFSLDKTNRMLDMFYNR